MQPLGCGVRTAAAIVRAQEPMHGREALRHGASLAGGLRLQGSYSYTFHGGAFGNPTHSVSLQLQPPSLGFIYTPPPLAAQPQVAVLLVPPTQALIPARMASPLQPRSHPLGGRRLRGHA
jgi:hypothetical protein